MQNTYTHVLKIYDDERRRDQDCPSFVEHFYGLPDTETLLMFTPEAPALMVLFDYKTGKMVTEFYGFVRLGEDRE